MRRALALALALGALVLAAGTLLGPSAAADAGTFHVVARGDAFRESVHATGAAADEITDVSGPTAQAAVDSVGVSEGFAALPYPGDTATTSAGLVSSLVLSQVGLPPPDLPPYPLVARTQFPGQQKDEASQGPVKLSAESTQ